MGIEMKLTYLYYPADDLAAAVAFHRDELGLSEAWREGVDTVAFWLPDHSAQIMVSTPDQPAGPMYLVEDVRAWLGAHPAVKVAVERFEIPGGSVAGLAGPNDYIFYVFDQPDA
jgi:hypothetical protein